MLTTCVVSKIKWTCLLCLALAVPLLLLLCAGPVPAQMVDLNGNGMSDLWEGIFGATNLDPNADTDGDGVSNRAESVAATNPFDTNSFPHIAALWVSGTNVSVSMAGALGKRYELQSLQSISNCLATNWTVEAFVIARTSTVVSLTAPANAAAKFFRIRISDVDSDGDGVNDWEEYQLGLDPFDPYSNGQLDAKGQPLNDYAYLTNSAANVVTLQATGPTATQPLPGQPAVNAGTFTLRRAGSPLRPLTVALAVSGPGPGLATEGVDFAALPRSVTLPTGVSSQAITLVPLVNSNLLASVLATVTLLPPAGASALTVSGLITQPPASYTVGAPSNATVIIYPSAVPSGSGLTGQYYSGASANYADSINFNPTNLVLTRTDPVVDFVWGTPSTPIPNNGSYTVRWTGQVQPRYSEQYTFVANTSDGVRLWVNGQRLIDNWALQPGAADASGSVTLVGGARYNIQMDYFNLGDAATAHLSWYSPSQPRQLIASNRLYSSSAPAAAPAITSAPTALAFLGQPFTYTIVAVNSPLGYNASPLPPGLSLNPTNGLLSGTPTALGDYQLTLLVSNTVGLAASALDLQVVNPNAVISNQITREVWSSIPGTNVSDIPLDTAPSAVSSLSRLEGVTHYATNYGERIQAYLTPSVSGNYYFWIAGSDSAELWISDDSEAVARLRRAYVSPVPGTNSSALNGTAPRQWNVQPNQKSPWLALTAGQKYYLEVLHKAGAGTNDNWAVGWLQDSTGTNTTPIGVVPGSVLSPYFAPPLAVAPGTLYAANLLAQATVASTAVGPATLRLSADQSQAILNFTYTGLSSTVTGRHIHSDPYLNNPSQILFDIDQATPQPDGSYLWTIAPVGTLDVADILELLKEGKAYMNVHTADFPAGEISGHFTLATGTQTFAAPPTPPAWTDDHADPNGAARFLLQASFGPSPSDIAAVQALGYDAWIGQQFGLPVSHHLPYVLAHISATISTPYPGDLARNSWWQQSVTAPDQLRQRMAFALSQIMVVSDRDALLDTSQAVSGYYDLLLDNGFGNFRALLKAVTLSPAMGLYLDMLGNDKANASLGTHPNENYARELMQLFSLGLNRLWPDGSLILNSKANLVPTYSQSVITGLASALSGWNYAQPPQANGRLPVNWFPARDYTNAMVLVPSHHETAAKLILDNVVLPPAQGSQANPASADYDAYGTNHLETALDAVFNHPNLGPFICRQLIQRLVTSSPSRDYVYRVAQKFNDNGCGVRGDLQAVLKAILLDYEARSSVLSSQATYGKQREPVLRATAIARAFPPPLLPSGTYNQNGGQLVTVTTSSPHGLNTGNWILLNFTDTSGQPPPVSQGYPVTVTGPNTFTISPDGLVPGTYMQSNQVITVTAVGHGLLAGQTPDSPPGSSVYLQFASGGARSGVYPVRSVPSSSVFTVATSDPTLRSGNCFFPLYYAGYTMTSADGTNTFDVFTGSNFPHGLHVNDPINIQFLNEHISAICTVISVADAEDFVAVGPAQNVGPSAGIFIYPLVPPPLTRSGTVSVLPNTWSMSQTDDLLGQTPLHSPTVFNFFSPDYKFPGLLASAGMTTPEFQLTTDTAILNQMNFFSDGLLIAPFDSNAFVRLRGAILMDLGAWMTTNYTATATGLGNLVDGLSAQLLGGPCSAGVRSAIVNCLNDPVNFPYDTPPTSSEMRRRLIMALYLLIGSPDFIIQK